VSSTEERYGNFLTALGGAQWMRFGNLRLEKDVRRPKSTFNKNVQQRLFCERQFAIRSLGAPD
jgi:hypothetical protein